MGAEWPKVTLDEVAEEITVGYVGSMTSEYVGSGVPFLRSKNVDPFNINVNDIKYISPEFNEKIRKSRLAPGDVVIVRTGKPGTCAVIPEWLVDANCSDLVIVRCGPKINNRYLAYYVNTVAASHVNAHLVGAVQQHFNVGSAKLMELGLPSMSYQSRVVDVLGALDDKIELNRQINATLESMAQALFKSWFVDFDPVIDNALAAGNPIPEPLQARAEKRAALLAAASAADTRSASATDNAHPTQAAPHTQPGTTAHTTPLQPLPADLRALFPDSFVFNEEMGWVPEGWDILPFGELLDVTIGGDWGKEETDDKHTKPVAIIRGTDIPSVKAGIKGSIPHRWVEEKKFKSRQLLDGDIVIEVSGGSPKQPTGRACYVTDDSLAMLNGNVVAASFCRKFRPTSKEIGLMAALHLDFIYAQGKMWGYQNQSTGISNFQTKVFLETEMVLMPKNMKIAEKFFSFVRPMIDRCRSPESEQLAEIRDALLPKLLSGQIKLPEAEKLAAEAL